MIGTAFVEKRVNAVGFSTALFLNLYQPCILQFSQSVDRLLPAAMKQLHHFVDGIVQIYLVVIVFPSVLSGKICPSQDICVQYLRFIGNRLIGWCFKQEVWQLCEALCLFLLMDIDRKSVV